MISLVYASLLLLLAGLPTLMVLRNLPLFHRAPPMTDAHQPPLSVLIPARNEEAGIAATLDCVLANRGIELEVVVLDDHSTDRTADIVAEVSRRDPRVRLVSSAELPAGWNGKQHACWQLAGLARHERLVFLDADVHLAADALWRLSAEHDRGASGLLSGFPRQITVSLAERLLIPLMHFVLLGYLPLSQMRATRQVQFGAGCGQLFVTTRTAYRASGGHAAIKSSRHDGLQLPRCYRRADLSTDLFDASDVARVRMYSGWGSVASGLLKNATEGMANRRLIVPFTCLLLGAAVLPLLSLAYGLSAGWPTATLLVLGLASGLSFTPRAVLAARLGQSWLGVALHPLAVVIFVGLQWWAWLGAASGRGQVRWKGRL